MKYLKLAVLIVAVILTSCNEDPNLCLSEEFSENGFKWYLPYSTGDIIIFSDSMGNNAEITIKDYQLVNNSYGRKDCFQPSESFDADIELKYDSTNYCNINFHSNLEREMPFLIVNGDNCQFQAAFENFPTLGNSTITRQPNYEYKNDSYDVLSLKMDSTLDLNEMVIAKDFGFLFVKINGRILDVE